MDTACLAYNFEPEREELFRHMIHDELDKWVDELVLCPNCGKSCKNRRYSSKQMVTMQGDSELNRPWFYCMDCSLGFSPPS